MTLRVTLPAEARIRFQMILPADLCRRIDDYCERRRKLEGYLSRNRFIRLATLEKIERLEGRDESEWNKV